jgi:hypothetical protein
MVKPLKPKMKAIKIFVTDPKRIDRILPAINIMIDRGIPCLIVNRIKGNGRTKCKIAPMIGAYRAKSIKTKKIAKISAPSVIT